jgi:arylsulfatase A-like enzyme
MEKVMTDAMLPNILWICTDQQRFDTIGALGNPHIHTPNIDRLVKEGVGFTHAYCQNPVCTPSRASFLTGMYPSSVHACMNGNCHWADAAPLVTRLLANAGYDCGLVGKLHLAGAAGRIEPRPDDGYRVFHWSHHPYDDWDNGHAYADWLRAKGVDPGELFKDPAHFPIELHQSSWCADMTINFIEEARDQPWLMSVNFFDPHAPFDPPQTYLDRYDPNQIPYPAFEEIDLEAQERLDGIVFQTAAQHPESYDLASYFAKLGHEERPLPPDTIQTIIAAYYAMIELIDDNIGRMLEALERTGQRENTIIIFMSDHGEMLGDHGLLLKGCRFYEGLVRVPLIISWPDHITSGLVSDALVELTDIAPTLLDFCGQSRPARMQGQSLRSLLLGQTDLHHHRPHVRSEYYRSLGYLEEGKKGTYATMIRDERYKLVTYHGLDWGELFDLENDPFEFNNLWGDPEFKDIRFRLLKQSFDDLAFAVDLGPEQVTLY